MQMTKSKTDQSIPGIYIILSNISRGTAFLHQVVTNCGFRKLLRCNLHFFISLAFSHLHWKDYGWLAPSQGCCVSFLLCFVCPCLTTLDFYFFRRMLRCWKCLDMWKPKVKRKLWRWRSCACLQSHLHDFQLHAGNLAFWSRSREEMGRGYERVSFVCPT